MGLYKFPDDIQDTRTGHWMNINAFEAGSDASSQPQDTFTLYIPGGPQNGSMSWQTKLDYEDIKIAHVVGGQVALGVSGAASTVGAVINPKVEVLFRNVELRAFQFNFLFAPISENESKQMQNIIKMMRAHASPEVVGDNGDPQGSYIGLSNQKSYLSSGGWFKSPSEFTIRFYYRSPQGTWQENLAIPRIARCVIERIDVDYAGANGTGEFSTFSNGHPVAAALTVVFREMRIVGRKDIAMQGGY